MQLILDKIPEVKGKRQLQRYIHFKVPLVTHVLNLSFLEDTNFVLSLLQSNHQITSSIELKNLLILAIVSFCSLDF